MRWPKKDALDWLERSCFAPLGITFEWFCVNICIHVYAKYEFFMLKLGRVYHASKGLNYLPLWENITNYGINL